MDLIPIKEAAEYLRVSKVTMTKIIERSKLEVFVDPLDTRKKLVRKQDLDRLKTPQPVKKASKK